jgi:hypothetical protein
MYLTKTIFFQILLYSTIICIFLSSQPFLFRIAETKKYYTNHKKDKRIYFTTFRINNYKFQFL